MYANSIGTSVLSLSHFILTPIANHAIDDVKNMLQNNVCVAILNGTFSNKTFHVFIFNLWQNGNRNIRYQC